jgi:hypothetical protein
MNGVGFEQVAEHLDMSERNARDVVKRLSLDLGAESLDSVRVAYVRHLRSMAAGRGGEEQYNLARAKARQAEVDADLKSVQLAERLHQLVPAEEVQQTIEDAFSAVRGELLGMRERILDMVEAETGKRVDDGLLTDIFDAALANLAAREGDSASDGEPDMEDLSAA